MIAAIRSRSRTSLKEELRPLEARPATPKSSPLSFALHAATASPHRMRTAARSTIASSQNSIVHRFREFRRRRAAGGQEGPAADEADAAGMSAPLSIDPSPGGAAAKRPPSSGSTQSLNSVAISEPVDDADDAQPNDHSDRVPAFLRQTKQEIRVKFENLNRQQLGRLQDRADPESPWYQEVDEEVYVRNRYADIQPWAHNRVHLNVPEGECDYINASPILLRSSKTGEQKDYISTQGPKEGQFGDFWRMIWDETTSPAVIIMLTRTTEDNREKCSQYFPVDFTSPTIDINTDDEPLSESDFSATVTLVSKTEDPASGSTIRKLRLVVHSNTDGEAEEEGEENEKEVYHFLFSGWPDYLIPQGDNRAALLELIAQSQSLAQLQSGSEDPSESPSNPRIIHCSAGVGRSGTFIALDHLLSELHAGALDVSPSPSYDPVFSTVNELRSQRVCMVQGRPQYEFIYEVLKEQWMERQLNGAEGAATKRRRLDTDGAGASEDEEDADEHENEDEDEAADLAAVEAELARNAER
ncbi:MAG: hypothetical protein M1819_006081 [Sarea resinae]|nr:MAG: hypothetical protein M1819_006081 [Sarea resinae]